MTMNICDRLGIAFPLFAFSHCRDVVAAVSRAGGMGVFGAGSHTPEELEAELGWIDAHVDGKPYGVDLVVPEHLPGGGIDRTATDLAREIPDAHWQFTRDLLEQHGVDASQVGPEDRGKFGDNVSVLPEVVEASLDIVFRHPIALIANALGVPPRAMIERARQHQIPVAALVGAREHALRQVEAGVDILVVQGTEAGGHCGEVSTLVVVPDVLDALGPDRTTYVLAAGGIMTGRQMAAVMALGADGAWTGSVWLPTVESEVSQAVREKLIEASPRDAVRSRSRTGKPCRQLRSAWTEAWDGPASPGPLPMPMQQLISLPAFERIDHATDGGNHSARALSSYFVGQGIGLVHQVSDCRHVYREFVEGFAAGYGDLDRFVQGGGEG